MNKVVSQDLFGDLEVPLSNSHDLHRYLEIIYNAHAVGGIKTESVVDMIYPYVIGQNGVKLNVKQRTEFQIFREKYGV